MYPSLIVAQSGGGDGLLFRPSKIPFLYVVRRWSPIASASGSVTLSDPLLPFLYNFYCVMYSVITYLYVLVLPHDFYGNQTTAHPVMTVCVAVSLASPSLMGE